MNANTHTHTHAQNFPSPSHPPHAQFRTLGRRLDIGEHVLQKGGGDLRTLDTQRGKAEEGTQDTWNDVMWPHSSDISKMTQTNRNPTGLDVPEEKKMVQQSWTVDSREL